MRTLESQDPTGRQSGLDRPSEGGAMSLDAVAAIFGRNMKALVTAAEARRRRRQPSSTRPAA